MRINKTEKNLLTVWTQLDNASGELYNAFDNLSRMVALDEEIQRLMDRIDITLIDGLKNEIDEIIEKKKFATLCPCCKKNLLHPEKIMNSLSRRDNETYICSDCGMAEAFSDAGLV